MIRSVLSSVSRFPRSCVVSSVSSFPSPAASLSNLPFPSRSFSSSKESNNKSDEQQQEGSDYGSGDEEVPRSGRGRKIALFLLGSASLAAGFYFHFRGKRDRLSAISADSSSTSFFDDTVRGFNDWKSDFFYSSSKPLLPMEMPDNFGRKPRTLVLNLEKTLVHAEWDRFNGWRVRKRPGVEKFLERAARAGWELVVFSDKPRVETEQTVQLLDRMGLIRHRLYYEDTNMVNWKICKNLDRLCRDPKRILVLDWNDGVYCGHEDNVIKLKPFTEDTEDEELRKMGDILEKMIRYNVVDTRTVASRVNNGLNPFEQEENLLQWTDSGNKDKKDDKKKSGWNSLLTKSLTQQNKKKLTQEFESD